MLIWYFIVLYSACYLLINNAPALKLYMGDEDTLRKGWGKGNTIFNQVLHFHEVLSNTNNLKV